MLQSLSTPCHSSSLQVNLNGHGNHAPERGGDTLLAGGGCTGGCSLYLHKALLCEDSQGS